MYIRYVLFLIGTLIVTLLTWILSLPLATYSVLSNRKNLPKFLYYFQTYDDDLDGGQHQLGWKIPSTKLDLIFQRAHWLCRNPAAGFKTRIFGCPIGGTTENILIDNGEVETSNSKFFSILTTKDNKKYFCYRTYRLYFGWNRWEYLYNNNGGYMSIKWRIKFKL